MDVSIIGLWPLFAPSELCKTEIKAIFWNKRFVYTVLHYIGLLPRRVMLQTVDVPIVAHLWLHSLQIFWSANMPQNVFLNNCSCPVFCKWKKQKDTFGLDNLRGSYWITLVSHFTYLKNFVKLICEVTKKFKSILKEKGIYSLTTTINTCKDAHQTLQTNDSKTMH